MQHTQPHSITENMPHQSDTARGYLMGFVDSQEHAQRVQEFLEQQGFTSEHISLLVGEAGWQEFDAMMSRSNWGEAAQKFQKQGKDEMEAGSLLLLVEVPDNEGIPVGEQLKTMGIRRLHHFGTLIDTQFTP